MVNSDLRKLVMRIEDRGESVWIRFVGGGRSDGEDLCDSCDGPVKAGVRIFSEEVYRDVGLTVRELGSGGPMVECENCLLRDVLATYRPDLLSKLNDLTYWFHDAVDFRVDPDALFDRTKTTTGGS